MPLIESIEIELDVEKIAAAMRMGSPDARLAKQLEDELPAAMELFRPAVLYEWLEVEGVEDHEVVLRADGDGGEKRLRLGPMAKLMSKAGRALVGAATVGARLDEELKAVKESGDFLRSYFIDSLGVAALAETGRMLCLVAEKEAASRSWGVGRRLAPGSLRGWEMEGQEDLCRLLPLEQMGLTLNDSCMLVPHKSASCLIGIGPGYEDSRTRTVCEFCPRSAKCWRRRDYAS